jgi:hypothetical protein
MEEGERMLIRCEGGPSRSRLERYPPSLEVRERDGMYVLQDEGDVENWWYLFVPNEL